VTRTLTMNEFNKRLDEIHAWHDRLKQQVKENHDNLLDERAKMSEKIVNLQEKVIENHLMVQQEQAHLGVKMDTNHTNLKNKFTKLENLLSSLVKSQNNVDTQQNSSNVSNPLSPPDTPNPQINIPPSNWPNPQISIPPSNTTIPQTNIPQGMVVHNSFPQLWISTESQTWVVQIWWERKTRSSLVK